MRGPSLPHFNSKGPIQRKRGSGRAFRGTGFQFQRSNSELQQVVVHPHLPQISIPKVQFRAATGRAWAVTPWDFNSKGPIQSGGQARQGLLLLLFQFQRSNSEASRTLAGSPPKHISIPKVQFRAPCAIWIPRWLVDFNSKGPIQSYGVGCRVVYTHPISIPKVQFRGLGLRSS